MDMLMLSDGTLEMVSDMDDFLNVVDKHMGTEARRWLEEYLEDADEI